MPVPRLGKVSCCACCNGACGLEPRPDSKFATDRTHTLTWDRDLMGYVCQYHLEIITARQRCREGKS
jgi:hypothetical protein